MGGGLLSSDCVSKLGSKEVIRHAELVSASQSNEVSKEVSKNLRNFTLAPLRKSGFAYERSEAGSDSEQIEHTVAKQQVRNSVSVEQIQDGIEGEGLTNNEITTSHFANAPRNDRYHYPELVSGSQAVTNPTTYSIQNPSRPSLRKGRRKIAFTLSEVLITLGILGIVIALTLPNLIANYKNRVIAKQLQKTYSTLSQAISLAQAEYGDISQWPIQDGNWQSTDTIYADYLKPHLKILKECRDSTECISKPDSALQYYTFVLADGTQILLDVWNHQENTDDLFWSYGVMSASKHFVYGQFLAFTVDVNGYKKPNKSGEDIFVFILAKNGLIPLGLDYDQGTRKAKCVAPSANFCTAYFMEKY